MKKILLLTFTTLCLSFTAWTQDALPYHEIPDYSDEYNAGTMAARMVDGLGFRFYWATEGLRAEDLAFRPNEEARTVDETIDHVLYMSFMIVNAVQQTSDSPEEGLSFEEKRATALNNFKATSDILRKSTAEEIESFTVNVGNGMTFPFWNLVNGPIADCIWHCGQIVSFRRSAGNPFNSNASMFNGKLRK